MRPGNTGTDKNECNEDRFIGKCLPGLPKRNRGAKQAICKGSID